MDDQLSINEILVIVNEKFFLKNFYLVGIDDTEILIGNGEYGITWDIMTQNIRIYLDGIQVVFISKFNMDKGLGEIDIDLYHQLVNNLISIIDKETLNEIGRGLQKCEVFERYEDAAKLKKFLDQFY